MSNIRKLQKGDLQKGFLTSLDSLRKASDLDMAQAIKIFEKITSNPDHIVLVAELDGRIAGCITLLIEQKFIHRGGKIAHMEDLAVDERYQGRDIGQQLMEHAINYAKTRGCYKIVLVCPDNVKAFHERFGFKPHENALRFDPD